MAELGAEEAQANGTGKPKAERAEDDKAGGSEEAKELNIKPEPTHDCKHKENKEGEGGAARKRPGEEDERQKSRRPRKRQKSEGKGGAGRGEVEGGEEGGEEIAGYRKVVLRGLSGIKQDTLEGAISRSGLSFAKIWKQRSNDFALLWLLDDPRFLSGCRRVLNGMKVQGRGAVFEDFVPKGVDETQGAAAEGSDGAIQPERSHGADEASIAEGGSGSEVVVEKDIWKQVTPLYDLAYEDQIYFKECLLKGTLKKLTKRMLKELKQHEDKEVGWLTAASNGPCCQWEGIREAPQKRGYRNKNEFTIGYDRDNKPMVGFRYGKFMDGDASVGSPDGVIHVPDIALDVARCLKQWLREEQDLECWQPKTNDGTWRLLTVRHNVDGDVMALVQYSTNNSEEAKREQLLKDLQAYFQSQVEAGKMRLTSLYFQVHNSVGNRAEDSVPVRHVWGKPIFHERMLSLKFRISPTAFFQVNTPSAEVLNGLIRDWAAATGSEVVLDVCCGTGTIGLAISSGAKKVVGIEICESAVEDAKKNSADNGVENCEWLAGKAEDKIKEAIEKHVPEGGSCVAVVDPPREGLHWKVLRVLRATPQIERIIYVSCNHVNWIDQARSLCSSVDSRYEGVPFQPIKASGVDLFPHTPHIELITLLERGKTLEDTLAAQAPAQ